MDVLWLCNVLLPFCPQVLGSSRSLEFACSLFRESFDGPTLEFGGPQRSTAGLLLVFVRMLM